VVVTEADEQEAMESRLADKEMQRQKEFEG
jgi:hypothetical protein